MKERILCEMCTIEMDFHPVTTDYTLTEFELRDDENFFGGILDEFYSCPVCGRTASARETTLKDAKILTGERDFIGFSKIFSAL